MRAEEMEGNLNHLMLRKVQRLGTSSLIITLPRDWARRNGLKAGNVVSIIEDGDRLVIAPHSRGKPLSASFSLRHITVCRHLGRVVFCAYLSGLDYLIFRSNRPVRPEMLDRISKVTSLLGGEDLARTSLKSMYEIEVHMGYITSDTVEALINYGRLMASAISRLADVLGGVRINEQELEALYDGLRSSAFTLLRAGSKGFSYGVSQEHLNRLLIAGVGLMTLANESFYALGRDVIKLVDDLSQTERERLRFVLQLLEVSLVAAVSSIDPPSVKKEEEAYEKLRMLLDIEGELQDVLRSASPQFSYLLARALDLAKIINNVEETLMCHVLFRKYSGSEEEP